MNHVAEYFSRLTQAIGRGWTRFWFTPSDAAALSLMRVCAGSVVVYLHATLSLDLIEFFGPNGLLPAAEIAPLESSGGFVYSSVSYLSYLSAPGELWGAHLAGLAALVLFTLGFWTRLTSVLALVVFLSDVHRAPMITSSTEVVAAMLLCYLCLAPCGKLFSLDRLLARRAGGAALAAFDRGVVSTSCTIATRLVQVHLALLVAMMGFSKLGGEVWWTGMGTWWLMARGESRLVDFTWLHASPKVVYFWTHMVVLFEILFGVLIWIPLARPLLLGIALVVWTSLALLTGEITLALLLLAASLAFVSPALVRQVFSRAAVAIPKTV